MAAGDKVCVFPTRCEVGFCEIEVAIVERAERGFVRWRQQVSGNETSLGEFIGRNIAAAFQQIRREIAQDVDELKTFAEADAKFLKIKRRGELALLRCIENVGDA